MSASNCLRCKAALPCATSLTELGARPSAGDVSICLYCGNIAVFTGRGVELRTPTFDELAELASDPDVRRTVNAVRAQIAARARQEGAR